MSPSSVPAEHHDVAALSNEDLVRFAREADPPAALCELLTRYYPWIQSTVARWGTTLRLRADDREDAQQQAVFAVREALARYGAASFDANERCSFRTFVIRVVWLRFRDFVRAKQRQERCIDYSVPIGELLAREALQPRRLDPAALAAQREWQTRLDAALRSLDAPLRRLWEARAAGHSLRTSASLLGISYHQVKRLQRQMLSELRAQLRDDND